MSQRHGAHGARTWEGRQGFVGQCNFSLHFLGPQNGFKEAERQTWNADWALTVEL